jgi:hypothetical protein
MPELGYKPVNKYLPPRERRFEKPAMRAPEESGEMGGFLRWVDRMLSR